MTAGSGIVHQEMPNGDPNGRMYGFQLWANLPGRQKMMAPRYRDVTAEQIPRVELPNGAPRPVRHRGADGLVAISFVSPFLAPLQADINNETIIRLARRTLVTELRVPLVGDGLTRWCLHVARLRGRRLRACVQRSCRDEDNASISLFLPHVVRSASVGDRFAALIAGWSPAMPLMSSAATNPPIIATGGTSVAQPLRDVEISCRFGRDSMRSFDDEPSVRDQDAVV
jgi:hypothetical protein